MLLITINVFLIMKKYSATAFAALLIMASLYVPVAFAQEVLSVPNGGTGSSWFTPGTLIFMGTSTLSETEGVFWDALKKRLGIGTTAPEQALDLGVNNSIQLATNKSTYDTIGLLRLQSLTNEAKAAIAYQDALGDEVIWLQTHDYLSYPTNRHKHFSIEASDAKGLKQTRLSVGYGADVVDVTVNQADLVINRNSNFKNGNLIMRGGGGGGVFKHANAFSFYPSYVVNGSHALQLSLQSGSELTLRALGSDTLTLDDSLKLSGNLGVGVAPTASLQLRPGGSQVGSAPLKLSAGLLLDVPEDGALEYDSSHIYFTVGSERHQLDGQNQAGILHRTVVADEDYLVQVDDELVAYTELTAGRIVTLPAPDNMTNRIVIIKDESGVASTSPITVLGGIDGMLSKTVDTDYGSLEVYSSGSAWFTKK
jgi:hypothetical protein